MGKKLTNFLFKPTSAILFAILFAQANAFELSCEVDDFTDEELCNIQYVDRTTGEGILIGHTDNMKRPTFAVLDFSDDPLFKDYMLVRVDDLQARDLASSGLIIRGERGFAITSIEKADADSFFQDIADGETLKVRLSVFNGGFKDFEFSTEGFDTVWSQFKEKSPLW